MSGKGLPLSPRELQILKFCAEGLGRKEMAFRLGISVKTVDYYFNGNTIFGGLYKKLGLHSTALLTQYALKYGIADWKV